MKIKSLCAAALVTMFVGGGVASAAVAAPSPFDTTGSVTVENGVIDTTPGIVDPEKPGEKLPPLPEVKPNPNEMGPLEVAFAPVLDFGVINTDTKAVTKSAAATTLPNGEKRGALVEFGDLRTDANGYTVTATLKQQFTHKTEATNVLTGSTITFTNPYFATEEGATGTAPEFSTNFTLGEAGSTFGGAQVVASAKNVDKAGKGMWAVEYGSSENVSATDTTGDSVILDVPANTASSMAGGDYEAIMEWAVTSAPGV